MYMPFVDVDGVKQYEIVRRLGKLNYELARENVENMVKRLGLVMLYGTQDVILGKEIKEATFVDLVGEELRLT